METRLRDILMLFLALLLLAVVAGAAVLLSRSRSQPHPIAALATRGGTRPHDTPTGASPPSPPPVDAPSSTLSTTTSPTAPSDPHIGTPGVTPTPSITIIPTLTPTPTVTPTPAPQLSARRPASLLDSAHRAVRNGDYETARAELARAAALSGRRSQVTAARYQAGVVAYLDADYPAARDLLDRFIATYPDDHRIPAAHFYYAETLAQLGDYPPAIEHYQAYLTYQDVLADLVYARLGRIHRFQGNHQAAVEAYTKAVRHAPDRTIEFDMREQTALAYQTWGHYEAALAEFQTIGDSSENPYRLARIWYRVGATYRLLGQEPDALQAFARATAGDPRPGYAHMALVELVHAGVEVDEYQRGLIDYHVESYQAAIDAFGRYMTSTPDDNVPDNVGDAHDYLARSWLALGDPARAVHECERALARPDAEAKTPTRWGDLWLLKAEAESEQGYIDSAVDTYRQFARRYPDHSLAPDALWRAALLLQQDQRHAESADSYTALADRYPDDDRAPQARFSAGLWRYWIGDVDAALGAWSELAEAHPDALAGQRGRYWLGKILWKRGLVAEGRYELEQLAQQHPRSYAGLRAAHLLAQGGRADPWRHAPTALHLTTSEQEERKEVLDWLHTWADLSAHRVDGQVADELAGSLHFRRAVEMQTLGLREQALDELKAVRLELVERPDPLLLYQLALVARDLELYAPSVRAAIDLIGLAPQTSVLDMPRLVQRLAYPAYYPDLVLAESQAHALDPLLLFALIRQESLFDAQVASWAGAVGLAQIMPATGEWIAEMTAWPEYDEAQLRRAYLSVKFGAWFLDRTIDQAGGDVITALAGYNGGPGLAQQWQENATIRSDGRGNGPTDPDLLVEIISKDETQRYVRAIYRHYHVYQHLYGDQNWALAN